MLRTGVISKERSIQGRAQSIPHRVRAKPPTENLLIDAVDHPGIAPTTSERFARDGQS